MKKYTYAIKYVAKEFAPDGVANYGITGDTGCKFNDIKKCLDDYIKSNGLVKDGSGRAGRILNSKGHSIATYVLNAVEID